MTRRFILAAVLLVLTALAVDADLRAHDAQRRIAVWEALLYSQVGQTEQGRPVTFGDMLVTVVGEGIQKRRAPEPN